MRKKDSDSFSTTSGTSKNSGEKGKKTPRFSLRNLFYRRHSSRKSSRSLSSNSNAEAEVRSVQSLQVPPSIEKEASSSGLSFEEAGAGSRLSRDSSECPLCLVMQPKENFPSVMTCHHRSCRDCLKQYLRIEITESRINIACPECAEKFHPNDIEAILGEPQLLKKYEMFMLRRVLVLDPDARWCPAPDCSFAVVASGCAGCPKLKCERPGCDTFFCYHCKQYWHPNQTCDAARAERSSNMRSSVSYSHDGSNSKGDIKPCPRCGAFIIKLDDGSCNHMTCAVCGAEFCWLCMKEISDLHYLSPSGCTFWGKKPWSRKKKILWQLGTMVGAPVGIALVAGIAVPAMLIGIPVWVGRKLHAKYEDSPRYKRNLIITAGVTGAVLVSPLLAGIAVGFGVPILLGYVYAVVPISLCRSGGCGVTTTNSGGVRFEFEEDAHTGATGGYSAAAPTDGHSVETASHHNVANPSIGPSIGEMSVAMTNSLSASGSHMDRVGVLRDESDRDSASNRAIAGVSLSGSLSGSTMAGQTGFQHRMEIQAELAAGSTIQKRASLSSESANFSLDAKSATVSFGDDASTKALAGSICTRDKDSMSAIVPSHEVHLDVTGTSARYLHGSTSHGLDTTSRPSTTSALPSSQGSPTSTRSVNFAGDEVIEYTVPCSKRYKRQSLSVGDSIYEHAEGAGDGLGALGLASNMSNLDAIPRGPSSPPGLASAPLQISASCSLTHASPRSVTSADNLLDPRVCPSRFCEGGITQVENDRPSHHLVPGRPRLDSTSTDSTSVETVSIMPDSTASSVTLTHQNTNLGTADCIGAAAAAGMNMHVHNSNSNCYYAPTHGSVHSSQSSSVSSSHALCAKLSDDTDDSVSTSSS